MDKREAEALYDSGKHPTVKKLLELDEQNRILRSEAASANLNSTNSSKPPSSDGPTVERKKQTPSGRKPGGQPGHTGKTRELLPIEEMDSVHELYPDNCEKCALPLDPFVNKEPSEPLRHQVFEIPAIKPIKTEYRSHELECVCGHCTRASLPAKVARSFFGPRVHAAIGYLNSCHFGTRRGICEIMATLFGINISLGALCDAIGRISDALEPPVTEIKQTLPDAKNLNMDETTWKSKGCRRTLWVFVSPLVVYFSIATSRGAAVVSSVLGAAFAGIITSDDHSAYRAYHKEGIRQLCWAHIIRKFIALADIRGSPDACSFATHMLSEIEKLFTHWYAFVDGVLTREELKRTTTLIRARMRRLCLHYKSSLDSAVSSRAQRTLINWDHLFTFIFHDGVEPTNNIAERALRFAVQWRKICFGSQSLQGERFTERILTVTRTCRLQGKNPFHFLCRLMDATFKRQPIPSLVSQS
jgi:transposase